RISFGGRKLALRRSDPDRPDRPSPNLERPIRTALPLQPDPLPALPAPALVEPPDWIKDQGALGLAIWKLIDQDDTRYETKCWRWTGRVNQKGRPRFYGTVAGRAH